MMLLQGTEPVQVGVGLLTLGNTLMLLRLSFGAGRYIEKIDSLERRMLEVESKDGCAAEDCALRNPRIHKVD